MPSDVTFIGEQSGPSEDQYKAKMSHFFGQTPNIVKRAYLARLTYGSHPQLLSPSAYGTLTASSTSSAGDSATCW